MPLFLKMGLTIACFIGLGKVAVSKLRLMMLVRGKLIMDLTSFRIFAGMSSCPTAVFVFKLSIRRSTSVWVTGGKE